MKACALRSVTVSRPAPGRWALTAPLLALIVLTCLQWRFGQARAETREISQFLVPSGNPDDTMEAAAAFARELDPDADISFRDSQSGSLSVSRIEDDHVKCIVRVSPDTGEALKPLGRFLDGRLERGVQAMWALAHEVGHCKLRNAFLKRPDGRVADASVFPWLAQEAAADAYGILSVERHLGSAAPVRQSIVISRLLSAAVYGDRAHATGHYLSDGMRLCERNRDDADAVRCAIAIAYYTVGSIANDESGSAIPVEAAPRLKYELGLRKVEQQMKVYDNIVQYKEHFAGADLRGFAFNEVSRNGESRYITAQASRSTDMTYRLADFYGFRTGELTTDDSHNVTVMRIDGAEELDWLLTLGAVVQTEDGDSLRKGHEGE